MFERGKRYDVLDHGYVLCVDAMGSDEDIVASARVSYGAGLADECDDSNTRRLINYLMRHHHTSPFEMAELKLEIQAPLLVARQWFRHRTAHVNEISARYAELPELQYLPPLERMQSQSRANKQASAERLPDAQAISAHAWVRDGIFAADAGYRQAMERGLSREVARCSMPMAQYTRWVWKIDAHNLLGFLQQRLSRDAQPEIRAYAEAVAQIVEQWLPLTWNAFKDYRLNAVTFSARELRALAVAVENGCHGELWCHEDAGREAGLSGGELREWMAKIASVM